MGDAWPVMHGRCMGDAWISTGMHMGGAAIPMATVGTNTVIHKSLLDELMGEFDEIRNDPERSAKEMDQMIRTYDKYLQQGNNPVEVFVPNNKKK